MRECSACREMKDATAFSPHPKGTRRICKPCNSALGLARENDKILRAMIAYLAHHRIRRSA